MIDLREALSHEIRERTNKVKYCHKKLSMYPKDCDYLYETITITKQSTVELLEQLENDLARLKGEFESLF